MPTDFARAKLAGMRIRSFLIIMALIASIVTQVEAQRASQYIPLDHWSTPHIEHLIRSGVIADPAPLTRPLHRAAVLRELSEVDTIPIGLTLWQWAEVASALQAHIPRIGHAPASRSDALMALRIIDKTMRGLDELPPADDVL